MSKIIGRTTATPMPRSDWKQVDETKADFIKNKPELGSLAEKDVVEKSDLSSDVQTSLGKADIALDEAKAYTDTSVSGLASTASVESALSTHNTGTDSHNDIRILITGLTDRLNALADSDDTTLDQMAEVVAYIKSNRTLIESITTNKVNVADIIDNLTTNVSDKPLSAAQGVAIKALIDELGIELDTHGHDIGDVSGLQNALDGKVPVARTVNGKPLNENISLVASDVGADASGTAGSAVSDHNEDPVSHTDIRDALSTVVYINPEDNENIEDPQDTKIDEHNVSPDAHADIRNLITAAQDAADSANTAAKEAQDTAKDALPVSGGTMTGTLTLSANPTEEFHAATKQYVDNGLEGKAKSTHNHSAANITSGTLSSDRLPVVPIEKGGTGATSVSGILTALGLGTYANCVSGYGNGGTFNFTPKLGICIENYINIVVPGYGFLNTIASKNSTDSAGPDNYGTISGNSISFCTTGYYVVVG